MIYNILTDEIEKIHNSSITEKPIIRDRGEIRHIIDNNINNYADLSWMNTVNEISCRVLAVLEYRYVAMTYASLKPSAYYMRLTDKDKDILTQLAKFGIVIKSSVDEILCVLGFLFQPYYYKSNLSKDVLKNLTFESAEKLLQYLKKIDTEEPEQYVVFSKIPPRLEPIKTSIIGSNDGKFLVFKSNGNYNNMVLYKENAELFFDLFDALHVETWEDNSAKCKNSMQTLWTLDIKDKAQRKIHLEGDATQIEFLKLDAIMSFATELPRFKQEECRIYDHHVVI
ncbi:MAG: hypothetical protein IK048_02825 [Clostridia bacterium]|nr:hypothetical protein [Clostridia bacterium]